MDAGDEEPEAGLADIPVLGLIGCTVCGFSVGIMWPGSISISSSVLPAGEDLQAGVLAGIGFPLVLVISVLFLRRWRRTEQRRKEK